MIDTQRSERSHEASGWSTPLSFAEQLKQCKRLRYDSRRDGGGSWPSISPCNALLGSREKAAHVCGGAYFTTDDKGLRSLTWQFYCQLVTLLSSNSCNNLSFCLPYGAAHTLLVVRTYLMHDFITYARKSAGFYSRSNTGSVLAPNLTPISPATLKSSQSQAPE